MRDDKVLGSTVRIDCTTHDSTGALVAPSSAFAASDFRIYKDGSATEKATTNGITVTSPFDSITGKHLIEIDTSNSTGDSGFWAAGSEYRVEINSAKTISSIVQSGVVVGRFALVAAGVLRPIVDGRTIAVAATTGAVELDSAVGVQLQAIEDGVDAGNNYHVSTLARIGSFAGTGVNNILGMFRALFRSDASTPSDMGGTATAADHSLQAVRVRGDAAWITGAGASATIVTLQSVAGISPGVIVGPSEPLVIGDDYLTAMNRSVRINLLDANGDPAEVDYGSYALDDVGISIQLLLAKSGKPSVTALIVGTCTFFPAVGSVPPYLIVEFTKVETAKAIPGPYDMQAEAVWSDGKVVTFAPYGQIQFTRNIARA